MNTVDTQLVISSIDWPRSGWSINSIIIEDNKRKLKKYFINDFFEFFKVKIFAVTRMKKGFKSSIGCNIKTLKSSHLLAPFTSTPTIGTRANKIKKTINTGKISFFNNDVSKIEKNNIIDNAIIVNIKCFIKKK